MTFNVKIFYRERDKKRVPVFRREIKQRRAAARNAIKRIVAELTETNG